MSGKNKGYDQFFKAARKASNGAEYATPSPEKGPGMKLRPSKGQSVKQLSPEEVLRQKLLQRRRRKKDRGGTQIPFPWLSVSLMGMFVATSALFLYDPSFLEIMIERVEIGWLSQVEAAGPGEKSSPTKNQNGENSAAVRKPTDTGPAGGTRNFSEEELNHFSKLNERKKELDLRERELNELEEELQRQKEEVEARIEKLEQIRAQIASVLKEKVDLDDEKISKLVEFYSNMKPKQAAEIMGELNEDLAVEVLGRMKKKNAAEIMNLLEPKKAQALSEKFAGYKRR